MPKYGDSSTVVAPLSDNANASALLSGHVRFSSSVLLALIKIRQSARQSQTNRTSNALLRNSADAETIRRIQQVAVELLRLLSTPRMPVTTGFLAVRFKSVLSDNNQDVIKANHFRALLRLLARCHRPTAAVASANSSTTAHDRSRDVWCLRDSFQTVGHYFMEHVGQCELSNAFN